MEIVGIQSQFSTKWEKYVCYSEMDSDSNIKINFKVLKLL